MNLDKKIYIHKPSKLFFFISIVIFFIWFNFLPINWRPVDDYGPIEDLILGKIKLIEQLKYLFYWFWGSYPPVWHFWAFNSYIFKNISIDISRNVLVLQGYFSVIISALLMSSLCQHLIKNKFNNIENKENFYLKQISDILSITIIAFNSQIATHAGTYMPYHLGFLTTTYSLFFIYLIFNKENKIIQKKHYYFSISQFKAFLLLLFFSTFIFQTYFIIFPAIFFAILLESKISFYKTFRKIKNVISEILDSQFLKSNFYFNIFFIIFIGLILLAYFRKLLILFNSDVDPGTWSSGIDNIFKLNDPSLNVFEYLDKLFFSLVNIFGISLYPFQYNQYIFSIIISALISLSLFIFFREKEYRFLLYFLVNIFIFAIYFATFQSLPLSPTRHNIYLMPIPVFLIISLILYFAYSLKLIQNKFTNRIFALPLISIFIFYLIGFSNSLRNVNFPENLRTDAIKMAQNSDFYLDLNYERQDISLGLFKSHGDKENNALMGKECTFEKINLNNKNPFNLFIYTNISNIDLKDEKIIDNTRGCLNGNFETKILKEIKIINNISYEQNNLISIDNNRYFYLIQVKKI